MMSRFTFDRHKIQQWTVFVMTFASYASFHACRQSFANAKTSLQEDWGFDKHREGALDAIFLFFYAFGLYGSGYIGDRLDAVMLNSFGLFCTAVIYIIFASLLPYFNFDSVWFVYFLWSLNGLFQSLGWPTAVKLVANWFDTGHDGLLFGVWASNQCIGNILGSLYVGVVHTHNLDLQWMFYLPAIQALCVSLLVCLTVRTNPEPRAHIDTDIQMTDIALDETMKRKKGKRNSRGMLGEQQLVIAREDDEVAPQDEVIEVLTKLTFCEVLKLKHVLTYSLCYALLKSVNYTMFFWLPYFESNHFSKVDGDFLEISYNIGQVFGGLACGYISDRFSSRTPTVVGFLICAAAPIFLLHVQTLPLSAVSALSFAAGLLVGGPASILSTVMSAEIAKNTKLRGNQSVLSTVTGIIDGSGSGGAAITQVIVALLSDISLELVFGMLTLQLLGSALLIAPECIRDIRSRRSQRQSTDELPGGTGADEQLMIECVNACN